LKQKLPNLKGAAASGVEPPKIEIAAQADEPEAARASTAKARKPRSPAKRRRKV